MSKGWQCPKCDCRDFDTDTIATTGSGWSKIFDMQNRKFTAGYVKIVRTQNSIVVKQAP